MSQALRPITASLMRDDGGDKPAFCVMAAFRTEQEARVALAAVSWHSGIPETFADVLAERNRQDDQWGGPAHDDEHSVADWLSYIDKQVNSALNSHENDPRDRERLVKIAALAVAAIKSIDRKQG